MSTMCKVYEFPKQAELPKDEAELLEILGEAYVKALYNALVKMVGGGASRDEMEEVNSLVHRAFLKGMNKAIEEYEES